MSRYEEVSHLPVGEMLRDSAEAVPEKEALIFGPGRMTYRELNQRADAFAMALRSLGLQKGDRVALYLKNSPELVIAFYGCQRIGAIVAWVNPYYRESEVTFILQNSGARAIVLFAETWSFDYLGMIRKLQPVLQNLEFIMAVGGKEHKGILDFQELMDRGGNLRLETPGIDIHKDLSMLLYTSGTTGIPKGAMINHYQAVRGGYAYSTGVGAGSEDVFIGFLPCTHAYGCGAILIQPFLLKSRVVLMETYQVEEAFRQMENEGVTLQLASPTHYLMELNHPSLKNWDLSKLRAGLIAGMIAPQGLITRVQKEMDLYISSFWGASEVGPGLGIICPPESPLSLRESSVGRPIPGTEAKVVGPLGNVLPDGEVGEMLVRGWHVLRGYWNNFQESRKQIESDGWLHTGDLVSKQKDGFIAIHGRIKDMINRGGYKIYPIELEREILKHPKVNQVSVVPTKNPVLGESICACVIPRDNNPLTLVELRAFLHDTVARQKLPDELAIMSDFPHMPGGVKIRKFGPGGLVELAENMSNREKAKK
ncbi:MAG: acyl--CoA ligase [Candidatus Tectomicrobia bacterium]|uniref:Acyl--CoA ligase n=1 Tax=Tectimicrobiota bacterium TaxID=2528274 RepID=A0A933GNP3_UNCTE|nr:acyl--CoA ligase [Candidatus Tectomicrobia bacterium]